MAGCSKTGECAYGGEVVEAAKKLKEADGVVFGSPVHYASISGNMRVSSQIIMECRKRFKI